MRPYNPHYPTMLREKIKYNRDSACHYNMGCMNGWEFSFNKYMYNIHIKDMRKEENKLNKYLSKYFKSSCK